MHRYNHTKCWSFIPRYCEMRFTHGHKFRNSWTWRQIVGPTVVHDCLVDSEAPTVVSANYHLLTPPSVHRKNYRLLYHHGTLWRDPSHTKLCICRARSKSYIDIKISRWGGKQQDRNHWQCYSVDKKCLCTRMEPVDMCVNIPSVTIDRSLYTWQLLANMHDENSYRGLCTTSLLKISASLFLPEHWNVTGKTLPHTGFITPVTI